MNESSNTSTNKTILHSLAKQKNYDLLFSAICYGYSQTSLDNDSKLFTDYLEKWEYNYIKSLYNAFIDGKLWLNKYSNEYDSYVPFGYSLNSIPMVSIIWENNIGVDSLDKILDSGINMNLININDKDIPLEYQVALINYGWIPKFDNSLLKYVNNFYKQHIWTKNEFLYNFMTTPINRPIKSLFNNNIVCISDTHWNHNKLNIPKQGEVLICSGDVCMPWHKDLTPFLLWLGRQPQKHKILVAGNHDKLIQNNKEKYLEIFKKLNIHYLEDSGIEINGIKFWGSPWTPKRHKNKNNAFTLYRKDLISKWDLIPSDTNVLITHCPPYGIGDCNSLYFTSLSYQSGDFALRKTINRLSSLVLHVFGHQHYGRGLYKGTNGAYFVNASMSENPEPFVF